MSRRDEIKRKKKLLADLLSSKKVEKKEAKKVEVKDADINGDGKVDEKDLSLVHKEYQKEKKKETKKKKVVKKKD